jgi:putative phosphoserine phosphatase/1-acylglycerol-3-phosphate O-acyltransferase
MSRTVAVFDLDHGLLTASPAGAVAAALADAGVRSQGLRAGSLLLRLGDLAGSPLAGEVAVRTAARLSAGTDVGDLSAAGKHAGPAVQDMLAPHARPVMDSHRKAGRRLVLTTVLPEEIAQPIADQLGFDSVVATKLGTERGRLDGRVAGPVVFGRGKVAALREWTSANGASVRRAYAYAGALQDAPLLDAVGKPTVIDPDLRLAAIAWLKGWPTRSFTTPPGVLTLAGRELQAFARPLSFPDLFPFARFELSGIENVPDSGPAIVCGNHRSYFDSVAVSFFLAKTGRNSRFLGKKEVFDVPVVGQAARWIGGIRVDRGTGSDEPLKAAAEALEGGDVIGIMPEGTIPRGPAFFDPELKGRWGAARLAAMTRAPVIPLGLWGTEKVWPRSSQLPNLNPLRRPLVSVRAGAPVALTHEDPDVDTKRIMRAISDLLPLEARVRREPTPEELRRTYPRGYKGDPARESARRPGRDI